MGKNIKSYAPTQVHSPGEGREALRQIIQNLSATNVIQLNRTHLFKFTTKFFISVLYFGKIQAN